MKIKAGDDIVIDTCPRCNSLEIAKIKIQYKPKSVGYKLYKFEIGIIHKCKDCKYEWDAPNEEYIQWKKHTDKYRELHWC